MLLVDLETVLEKLAPRALAEPEDNCGLLVGDREFVHRHVHIAQFGQAQGLDLGDQIGDRLEVAEFFGLAGELAPVHADPDAVGTASGAGAFIGVGGYDGNNYVPNLASGPATVIGGGSLIRLQIDGPDLVPSEPV